MKRKFHVQIGRRGYSQMSLSSLTYYNCLFNFIKNKIDLIVQAKVLGLSKKKRKSAFPIFTNALDLSSTALSTSG